MRTTLWQVVWNGINVLFDPNFLFVHCSLSSWSCEYELMQTVSAVDIVAESDCTSCTLFLLLPWAKLTKTFCLLSLALLHTTWTWPVWANNSDTFQKSYGAPTGLEPGLQSAGLRIHSSTHSDYKLICADSWVTAVPLSIRIKLIWCNVALIHMLTVTGLG